MGLLHASEMDFGPWRYFPINVRCRKILMLVWQQDYVHAPPEFVTIALLALKVAMSTIYRFFKLVKV